MEKRDTSVTQKNSTDMREDCKSTNFDHVSSSDEEQRREEDYPRENKELERTTIQTQADRMDDLDRHRAGLKNIKTGGDNGRGMESALPLKDTDMLKKEEEIKQQGNYIEIIGPFPHESKIAEITKGLAEEGHTGENKAHDRKDDQGDGQRFGLEEVSPPGPKDANSEAGRENQKETTQPPHMAPVLSFEEDKQTKTVLTLKQPKDEGENKQPYTTSSPTQVESHRAEVKEQSPDFEDTNTEPENGRGVECTSDDMDVLKKEKELKEQITNAETIGHTPEGITKSTLPEVTGIPTGRMCYLMVVTVVVVAILVQYLLQTESSPQTNELRQIDIFLRELEKVKSQFPSQRAELWNRSRIHLQRHLQTAQPTEPVSLILTAGLRAERTMQCVAQGLASAFSSALNASVLQIDGVSQSRQDSDQVKLDIDRKLQGAFEGDKPVAVIHRFEELPPGSTLIFYRYCDHENAAYKKTFLIFTVLLGEEEEIPAKIHLSSVEEMVDDHLQRKFLSHGHPVSFDRMDLDKYGGLWSRISHLILPVAAEERIEHEGCKET
ncbi:torsin-1A-interacting protein 2-like isoform X3 [Channa argus]|uniref:torsin-1A-interacting protein 2-like isoform X3 n=1 Tax=Channa argus TaxID=215402 RepID=UPI00351FE245